MSHVLSAMLQMVLRVLRRVRVSRGWALMRRSENYESLAHWLFVCTPRFQTKIAKCSTASRCVQEPPGIPRREFGGKMAWPDVWGQHGSTHGLRGWEGLE